MSVRINRLQLVRLEDRVTPSLTPVGPEFRVNQVTRDFQRFSDVAIDDDGDFVVAWSGYDDTLFPNTTYGIAAQRYAYDGTALGAPIVLSEATTESFNIHVARNGSGQFVVVWEPIAMSGHLSVYAQSFDRDGNALSPKTRVNASTSGDSVYSNVAINESGDFVVSWTEMVYNTSGTNYASANVLVRRFNGAATAQTGAIALATSTPNDTCTPSVAMAANGSFLVTWGKSNASYQIISGAYRVFSAAGQPLTAETPINSPGIARIPKVAIDDTNQFALTWIQYLPGLNGTSVWYERLDQQGVPTTTPTQLFTGVSGVSSYSYDISALPDGRFVATWGRDTLYAQSYLPTGSVDGPVVQVNTFNAMGTYYDQTFATTLDYMRLLSQVAVNRHGDVVATWSSWGQAANGSEVYAQRFFYDAPVPRPPIINGGDSQRSSVKSSELGFNRPLNLPANPATAFVLAGPLGNLPVTVDTSGSTAGGTKIKVIYPSLADGRYTLRMLAALVTDSAGQHLDGNGDGIPGDDLVVDFHKLTGDFNGDARVDGLDFLAFRNGFGAGDLHFDIDGDGFVNAQDFLRFRLQFLKMV